MTVGLTKDAGWEVGVSRTLPFPAADIWKLMTSGRGLRLWLGTGVRLPKSVGTQYETADGTVGELRGYQDGRRIRLTHRPRGARHETIVQATVQPKGSGATLGFHQERMGSAAERERQRAHWQSVMDDVEDALTRSTSAK